MANKFLKNALVLIAIVATGCFSPDYSVIYSGGGNGGTETVTVYEEVEVEVEVPVYIEVEVPGETEYGEIWVDSFTQSASVDGVDILWVIDTSGSMYRYDADLEAGIEAMLNALPASGWRLAMISNDPSKAQLESQFPLVPGDDIVDAMDMYSLMLRGPYEEGFDAVYEYLTNNAYATTWLRPDAALLVVFVSDEEEQSNQYMLNVPDFTSWYGSQRGGSAFVSSIINVAADVSVCTHYVNSIDIGDRYIEATNFFGGVVVDICEEDWSPGVTDATTTIEPRENLELTYVVSNEITIRVFINGALNWDWYYQASDNTVYFTTIPSGHDHVEIAYHYDPDDPHGTGAPDTGADTGDTGS